MIVVVAIAACDSPGGRGGQVPVDATTSSPNDTVTSADDATVTSPADTLVPDTSGPAPITDPACLDGQYDETLPNDTAAISDLISGYAAADYLTFVDQVLARRYPVGAHLVTLGNELGSARFGNCVERFTSNRNTAASILGQMSTVVHECGHIADLSSGGFSSSVYLITENLDFECSSAAARLGDSFERSRLNGDAYAELNPDDFYRDVYLDGDPDDGTFDGGDQGYDSVLEEATQYVNSLATDWALRDTRGQFGSVSARDGILTFLWYIERYLRMARLEFPATYSLITTNACWRELTLTIWGRAWLYLELSANESGLGISDDFIEELVLDPDLLGEIERLREAQGCP